MGLKASTEPIKQTNAPTPTSQSAPVDKYSTLKTKTDLINAYGSATLEQSTSQSFFSYSSAEDQFIMAHRFHITERWEWTLSEDKYLIAYLIHEKVARIFHN